MPSCAKQNGDSSALFLHSDALLIPAGRTANTQERLQSSVKLISITISDLYMSIRECVICWSAGQNYPIESQATDASRLSKECRQPPFPPFRPQARSHHKFPPQNRIEVLCAGRQQVSFLRVFPKAQPCNEHPAQSCRGIPCCCQSCAHPSLSPAATCGSYSIGSRGKPGCFGPNGVRCFESSDHSLQSLLHSILFHLMSTLLELETPLRSPGLTLGAPRVAGSMTKSSMHMDICSSLRLTL